MAHLATVRARARSLAQKHKADARHLSQEALVIARADEQMAFEVFRASKAAVLALTPREIDSLLARLHDWNSTDCFGSFVSGVAWREGVLNDAHIFAWTRSEHVWTRRAALVSTVPLNLPARGATAMRGEARRTLAVCAELVNDRDDMIVKALSWALRTLASRDQRSVAAFIEKHRSRLAPRVVRETRNQLETGLKNPPKTPARKRPTRRKQDSP